MGAAIFGAGRAKNAGQKVKFYNHASGSLHRTASGCGFCGVRWVHALVGPLPHSAVTHGRAGASYNKLTPNHMEKLPEFRINSQRRGTSFLHNETQYLYGSNLLVLGIEILSNYYMRDNTMCLLLIRVPQA